MHYMNFADKANRMLPNAPKDNETHLFTLICAVISSNEGMTIEEKNRVVIALLAPVLVKTDLLEMSKIVIKHDKLLRDIINPEQIPF